VGKMVEKMKVCMISNNYPPLREGLGFAVNRIAKNLKGAGIEVHVVTCREKGEFADLLKINTSIEDGVYVHRLMDKEFGKYHNSPYEAHKILLFLKKLHEKYSFDVFQGFGIIPCGFISSLISKMTGVPNIVSVRGYWGEIGILDNNFIKSITWTIENAARVSFVSESSRKRMCFFAECKDKSVVIYNSLDPGIFLYDETKKLDLRGFKIGVVGIMREKKGWDYMLEAFSRLEGEIKNVNLVLIGFLENGYVPKINGGAKNVVVTGFVEHRYILNYINQMDVVVIPSFSDGCPNVLLESMYCKKPVIATRVGAIQEIIKDRVNGVLVEPLSSEDIYMKLKVLLDDVNLREGLGAGAYQTVKNDFSPEKETMKWIEVYKKLKGG
jgi:glycosyltransferase involved in cell wall biosynthesis